MNKLRQYVTDNCAWELEEIKNKNLFIVQNVLSLEEHVIIFKYTEDGYESLNENLRLSEGKNLSEFGKYLDKTLNKLPDYKGIAYRSVKITDNELQKYLKAKENNSILVEHSFISASKSKAIANEFGRNCQFTIYSKSGKEIEKFAKYGLQHPQNEKEILFKPNLQFEVLEITKQGDKTLIIIEEI